MRSILIILVTVAVLGGGFFVYTSLQPQRSATATQPAVVTQSPRTASRPTAIASTRAADPAMPVAAGEKVFVETFDSKGNISSRFRAERYDPQPDGTVNVDQPEAEFFLADGQRLRLKGESGAVVVPKTGGDVASGRAQPPSRGELKEVALELYPAGAKKPTVRCRINNLAFDNDTFRISTEAYTDRNGNRIPADRVPVIVRGEDYDFDGEGLLIRWDERDRRLQTLEVSRCFQLIIKDPQLLKLFDAKPTARAEAHERPAIASADPTDAALAIPKERKPTAAYRASLNDAVRITRDKETLASSDALFVDFASLDESANPSTDTATTRRATRDDTRTSATTQNAPIPVTIRWTGKLLVAPLPANVTPPVADDRIIRLIGKAQPASAKFRDYLASASELAFHSLDGSSSLSSSPTAPLISIQRSDGTSITATNASYDGTTRVGVLGAKGRIEMPAAQGASKNGSTDLMTASWTDRAEFRLIENAGRLGAESANLRGDVKIDHPRFSICSEDASAKFSSPLNADDQPVPTEVAANGAVHCVMRDGVNAPQTVDCAKLNVELAKRDNGDIFLKTFTADGNVSASDGKSTLKAGHVVAKLLPESAVKQANAADSLFAGVQVESALATNSVRVSGENGQFAECERLEVKSDDQGSHIELHGSPTARAGDARSTLEGPLIKYDPEARRASVHGAGQLLGRQSAKSAQPFDVRWSEGLTFDANRNEGKISGQVTLSSVLSDQSTLTAEGRDAIITLRDPPTENTAPSKAPPTDFLGGKLVDVVRLDRDVRVKSLLLGPDGSAQRTMHMFAPVLEYHWETESLVIPAPGRMLVQDERPVDVVAAGSKNAPPRGFRGATAFEWHKSLVYEQPTSTGTMSGDVLVVHKPSSGEESFRINAAEVAMQMESSGTGMTGDGAKLKKLIGSGGVTFVSSRMTCTAEDTSFDPIQQVFSIRGSDRTPAELFDEKGLSQGGFRELQFNIQTQQILKLSEFQASIRR